MTYNVRGFRHGRDRVAAVVRRLLPDTLLLQETGSRRDLRRFAIDVGMRVASDPWSPLRRRVKNAVLLAEPWRFVSVELVRYPDARRLYPRGALVTSAVAEGESIRVISTHFGLGGVERASQAASLVDIATRSDGATVIVGGDLNATPDMAAIRRIAVALRDAWADVGDGMGPTFPSIAPAARIDYVFVTSTVRVTRAQVPGGAANASDHLPVVVDLQPSPI